MKRGVFLASFQEDESTNRNLKGKVRLDFKGIAKPGRFIARRKSSDKAAEETREQQAAIFRNIPVQGIHIEDIDTSLDTYMVYDDFNSSEVAYAPLVLQFTADSLEDIIKFIVREDFRRIEIALPHSLSLNKHEIERFLFRVSEEVKEYKTLLEKKYNLR